MSKVEEIVKQIYPEDSIDRGVVLLPDEVREKKDWLTTTLSKFDEEIRADERVKCGVKNSIRKFGKTYKALAKT